MEFTDKTQNTVAEAIQLAKDYAHVQGMSLSFSFPAKAYNIYLYF
jgi:hypothetical protein